MSKLSWITGDAGPRQVSKVEKARSAFLWQAKATIVTDDGGTSCQWIGITTAEPCDWAKDADAELWAK